MYLHIHTHIHVGIHTHTDTHIHRHMWVWAYIYISRTACIHTRSPTHPPPGPKSGLQVLQDWIQPPTVSAVQIFEVRKQWFSEFVDVWICQTFNLSICQSLILSILNLSILQTVIVSLPPSLNLRAFQPFNFKLFDPFKDCRCRSISGRGNFSIFERLEDWEIGRFNHTRKHLLLQSFNSSTFQSLNLSRIQDLTRCVSPPTSQNLRALAKSTNNRQTS